jgi:hypothetical protein
LPLAVKVKRFVHDDLFFILGILLVPHGEKALFAPSIESRHGMPCRAAQRWGL